MAGRIVRFLAELRDSARPLSGSMHAQPVSSA